MNKILKILHCRKGETMVEILVSMLIVVMLLGAFGSALKFSSNSLRKSREIRDNTYTVKETLRNGTAVTWAELSKGTLVLEAQNKRTKKGSGDFDSMNNVDVKKVQKNAATINDVYVVRYKEVS